MHVKISSYGCTITSLSIRDRDGMDLIRAAIVGAPGTPYHDGLLFFDILLPIEYPHVPPMVHYHSGGLRLNPNLYESGKVCLSLLSTWTGTGSKVWNPASSTILEVLLSLQDLVLNAKPYFTEAGYDEQIRRLEGEKNYVGYNENAYLGTCKSMLYQLRRPPKPQQPAPRSHPAPPVVNGNVASRQPSKSQATTQP